MNLFLNNLHPRARARTRTRAHAHTHNIEFIFPIDCHRFPEILYARRLYAMCANWSPSLTAELRMYVVILFFQCLHWHLSWKQTMMVGLWIMIVMRIVCFISTPHESSPVLPIELTWSSSTILPVGISYPTKQNSDGTLACWIGKLTTGITTKSHPPSIALCSLSSFYATLGKGGPTLVCSWYLFT